MIQEALAEEENILSVKELCEIADVSRSGYYNWVHSELNCPGNREQSQRVKERSGLGKGTLLQGSHTSVQLDSFMVIEPDIVVNHLLGLDASLGFHSVNTLAFQNREKILRHGIVIRVCPS